MESLRHDRGWGALAVSISLLLHVLLAWAVLRLVIDIIPPPRVISVVMVMPPPVPKPAAPAKPKAARPPPVAKPVPHAALAPVIHARPVPHAEPGPVAHAKPRARALPAPPPGHFGTAGTESGLGLNLGAPSGGGANGQGGLGAFDDAVKQRIEAAKTYPPGLPHTWNECVVEYQVVVSRTGQLVSYKLYGCDDPFLDSAARAAILMASPFPVPPDFGGTQYTVFGSLVFKHH